MNSTDLTMLIDMGFPRSRIEKALAITGNQGVEPAMEWLLAHADELDQQVDMNETPPVSNLVASAPPRNLEAPAPNLSQSGEVIANTDLSNQSEKIPGEPSSSDPPSQQEDTGGGPPPEAKSIQCNDCNKLFKTQMDVEFHAAKSGHTNFSESTEEKKPMTEEERLLQMKLLEEKMREKRKEREEKEKQEALEREKNRIRTGKEISAAKQKLEDEEMRKVVEQRRREKEEDKMARQRVKEQIEADRLARKARLAGTAVVEPVPVAEPPKPAVAAPPKDYTQTRLQIRLTNGSALTQTFNSKEQLSAVRLFVEMNRTDGDGPFNLMINFPKKVFSVEDYEKPLDILGLVPSAVLIVVRAQF